MMLNFQTQEAYRAWASRRIKLYEETIKEECAFALDQAIIYARTQGATRGTYKDATTNLRGSTGVKRKDIPESKRRLPSLPDSWKYGMATAQGLVKKIGRGFALLFNIGMTYAVHVADRGPWPENALERFSEEFLPAALNRAQQRAAAKAEML